jgi:hypothetical protein
VGGEGELRGGPQQARRRGGARSAQARVGGGPSVRGWEGDLPPGYSLSEGDADVLLLLRPCGSVVAAFSAQGADPLEVIAAAWEDHE